MLFRRIYALFLLIYILYNLCQCYFGETVSLFLFISIVAIFPKDIVPIVPKSAITSISFKLQRLSMIPEQLRIVSQRSTCQKIIERKQQVQKLRRFDIETTQKNPGGELIDISSILKVESTSKYPRPVDIIISQWIRLLKYM